jgi:hypothetical protein
MSGFPCEYCGKPIENCGINQRFHPECIKMRRKEQRAEANREYTRPPRYCEYCGELLPPDADPRRKMHEECSRDKNNLAKRKSDILPRETVATKKRLSKQEKLKKRADERTIAAHKAGMTYGQYMVANGLVPAVEVKQPTNKYTYNQIRAMAEKNGISHREQAKALGL